jgi:multisubunit Na+/H+ antiporter MnhG subunit
MKAKKTNRSRIKKELLVALVCLLAAFGLYLFSIVLNRTNSRGIAEQWHIVILVAVLLYILILMFRLFAWLINRIFLKN